MVKKLDFEDVKTAFEESGCKLLESEYKNQLTKMRYICNCGDEALIAFKKFKVGQRCRKCSIEKTHSKQRNSFDVVKSAFEDAGHTLLSNSYTSAHDPLYFICKCNRYAKMSYQSIRKGASCLHAHLLSPQERANGRLVPDYHLWRKKVYERDGFTCQCCGDSRGGNLNAHHLDGYNWCISRRTDVSNGVTLCEDCHSDFHDVYGYGYNTEDQYFEWITSKKSQSA